MTENEYNEIIIQDAKILSSLKIKFQEDEKSIMYLLNEMAKISVHSLYYIETNIIDISNDAIDETKLSLKKSNNHEDIDSLNQYLKIQLVFREEFDKRSEFILMVNDVCTFIQKNINLFEEEFYNNLSINQYKLTVILEKLNYSIHGLNFFKEKYDENREINFNPLCYYDMVKLFDTLKIYTLNHEYKTYTNEVLEQRLKPDNRISKYAPTNNERLKALTEFCPELINRLHKLSKDEQKQVIHLITGVNKDDAYKKVMTANKREIEDTIIKNDEIDIEDLKNKLNNT